MKNFRLWTRVATLVVILLTLTFVNTPVAKKFLVLNHFTTSDPFLWVSLLVIAAILPIPSEPLMTASLAAKGIWIGTIENWIGACIAGTLLFCLGRVALSPILDKMQQSHRFEKLSHWVNQRVQVNKFLGVLVVQLIPVPFLIANILLGTIRNIRTHVYLLATSIAFLAYQVVWTLLYLGFRQWAQPRYTVFVLGAALVVFILFQQVYKNSRKKR